MDIEKLAERTSWPVKTYLSLWIFAFFAVLILGSSLDGVNRSPIQYIFLMLLLSRLGIAVWRKERNRIWIFYIIILIFAAPVYGTIESFSYKLWQNRNSIVKIETMP